MKVIFKNSNKKKFATKWNEYVEKNILRYKYLKV